MADLSPEDRKRLDLLVEQVSGEQAFEPFRTVEGRPMSSTLWRQVVLTMQEHFRNLPQPHNEDVEYALQLIEEGFRQLDEEEAYRRRRHRQTAD